MLKIVMRYRVACEAVVPETTAMVLQCLATPQHLGRHIQGDAAGRVPPVAMRRSLRYFPEMALHTLARRFLMKHSCASQTYAALLTIFFGDFFVGFLVVTAQRRNLEAVLLVSVRQ